MKDPMLLLEAQCEYIQSIWKLKPEKKRSRHFVSWVHCGAKYLSRKYFIYTVLSVCRKGGKQWHYYHWRGFISSIAKERPSLSTGIHKAVDWSVTHQCNITQFKAFQILCLDKRLHYFIRTHHSLQRSLDNREKRGWKDQQSHKNPGYWDKAKLGHIKWPRPQ